MWFVEAVSNTYDEYVCLTGAEEGSLIYKWEVIGNLTNLDFFNVRDEALASGLASAQFYINETASILSAGSFRYKGYVDSLNTLSTMTITNPEDFEIGDVYLVTNKLSIAGSTPGQNNARPKHTSEAS